MCPPTSQHHVTSPPSLLDLLGWVGGHMYPTRYPVLLIILPFWLKQLGLICAPAKKRAVSILCFQSSRCRSSLLLWKNQLLGVVTECVQTTHFVLWFACHSCGGSLQAGLLHQITVIIQPLGCQAAGRIVMIGFSLEEAWLPRMWWVTTPIRQWSYFPPMSRQWRPLSYQVLATFLPPACVMGVASQMATMLLAITPTTMGVWIMITPTVDTVLKRSSQLTGTQQRVRRLARQPPHQNSRARPRTRMSISMTYPTCIAECVECTVKSAHFMVPAMTPHISAMEALGVLILRG